MPLAEKPDSSGPRESYRKTLMDDKLQTRPDQKSRFSKKRWPVLILLGLVFGLHHWMSRPSVPQLPYSAFKAALRQGQIHIHNGLVTLQWLPDTWVLLGVVAASGLGMLTAGYAVRRELGKAYAV